MRHISPTALAALVLLTAAQAQEPAGEASGYLEVQGAFETWRAEHGETWTLRYDKEIGRAQLLHGSGAQALAQPVTEADWFSAARHFARETHAMHGIDLSTLVEGRVLFVPLGQIGTTDKMAVKFRQEVDGIPVEHGWFNVLFDLQGNLLAVDSTGQPGLAGFDTGVSIPQGDALFLALENFQRDAGIPATTVQDPELIIAQIAEGKLRQPHLVWRCDAQNLDPGFDPVGWTYYLDAGTGRVLDRRTSIHHFDVSGTVSSMLTPGTAPDTATNPEVSEPMFDVRVTSSQGNAVTDANGDFTIVGATAPVTVTVKYEGPWHNANNQAGTDYSLPATLTQASGNALLMNPSSQALVTAQANSAKWVSGLRNWIRFLDPSDATMDFTATSNCNISSTCNAYYNGSSVNFYQAGGGCVNTAYSTVVVHEMGHWANDRYGSGNGSDGFGEGNADTFAMYITDQPIVGEGFMGPGTMVRTGLNNRQFCGDSNPGCYGGVHADGEVLMGALWKVRARLKTTLGASAGSATADGIFSAWMNVYNDGQIKTIVEEHWLTLDDDDGNIYNGTPNFADIDGGFTDQGFPGIALQFVSFNNVTILGDTQDETNPRPVNADIAATFNPPVANPELYYRAGGGAFSSTPMTLVSGTTYTANVPAFQSPTKVEYYLRAEDNQGQFNTFPMGAPTTTISYIVGVVTVYYQDGFEAASGWTHGMNATQDDWQRSAEVGTSGSYGQSGDPANAFEGTNIWGNDLGPSGWNGAYQNNVSNWLRSPNIDLSTAQGSTLTFARWLTVEAGVYDQARVVMNGQVVWSNPTGSDLIDSSWQEMEIDVSQFDGNPSVQLEFRLLSDGGVVFGGWNIDDVKILSIEPVGGSCATTNYCAGKLNSQGVMPAIGSIGTPSVSAGDFELELHGGIAGKIAIYFWGDTQASIPFYGGLLCIQPPVHRGTLQVVDPFSFASWPIAVTSGMVGTERNYQVWGRDSAGSFGVLLSDGLWVRFCD